MPAAQPAGCILCRMPLPEGILWYKMNLYHRMNNYMGDFIADKEAWAGNHISARAFFCQRPLFMEAPGEN